MLVFGETVAMLVYEICVFFLFASVYMDLSNLGTEPGSPALQADAFNV